MSITTLQDLLNCQQIDYLQLGTSTGRAQYFANSDTFNGVLSSSSQVGDSKEYCLVRLSGQRCFP